MKGIVFSLLADRRDPGPSGPLGARVDFAATGRELLRVARLWCGVAAGVAALVALEVVCLSLAGYRYMPKSAIEWVSLRDYSMTDRDQPSAAIVQFRPRSASEAVRSQLVVIRQGGQRQAFELAHGIDLHRVAISKQGGLAVAMTDGAVYVTGLADGGQQELQLGTRLLEQTKDTRIVELVFSPNGRFLAARSDRAKHVWDLRDGSKLETSRADCGSRFLCFFPDGLRMLESGRDGVVNVRQLLSGDTTRVVGSGGAAIVAATISPNSRLALLESSDGVVHMWHLESNREMWHHSGTLGRSSGFSSDSRLVAYFGTMGREIRLCEVCSGRGLCRPLAHTCLLQGLRFARDNVLHYWDIKGTLCACDVGKGRERVLTGANLNSLTSSLPASSSLTRDDLSSRRILQLASCLAASSR